MKKYNLVILLIFLFSLCFFNAISAKEVRIVCIDPGHGGVDPGAFYAGIKEKDINLSIAHKLKQTLIEDGIKVYLTREDDYDLASKNVSNRKRNDLYKRSELINNSGCNIYLSLHLNADKQTSWRGAQVFYVDVNEKNHLLAEIIQKQLKKDLSTKRTYQKIKEGYLYKRVKIPGVLIEMGFLSNPYERDYLKKEDYQEKIASSIKKGILTYFEKYEKS